MIAAEGRISDIGDLCKRTDEAEQLAGQHQDPRLREALRNEIRTNPLDPMRSARDLLKDFLDGIRGCWLLYQEDIEEDDDGSFADAVRAEANANRDRLT